MKVVFCGAQSGRKHHPHPLLLNHQNEKIGQKWQQSIKKGASIEVVAAVTANGTGALGKVNRIRKMVDYIQIL